MNKIYTITPTWNAPSNIKAFTTLAFGGYSKNNYANSPYGTGLNPATHVGDDISDVLKNRQLISDITTKDIVWLEQIHSTKFIDLDLNKNTDRILQADASFCSTNDLACAVLTADCLPLLVTDINGSAVLAIHAGWKGLVNGIIENSIGYFIQKLKVNASNILVWLGPAISPLAFEVGLEVKDIFIDKALNNEIKQTNAAFIQNNRKNCADLYKLAKIRLKRLEILEKNIAGGDFCTFFDTRFYSYRRKKVTGRIASIIYKI